MAGLDPSPRTKRRLAAMEMQAGGRVKCCQMYNLLGWGPHCAPDCAYEMEEA